VYELTVTGKFAAAHNLKNFQGPCESLHGHNWKVEVTVAGTELDQAGMVIDFGEIKRMTGIILADLDHTYLNELGLFEGQSPSSENIARHIYHRLEEMLGGRARVVRVTAWESDTSRVSYLGPDA
jgi:6-pyruvoyltetrahydropterin/6-carboxytetrahydropterin synthase